MPVFQSIAKPVGNLIYNAGVLVASLVFLAAGVRPATAGTGPQNIVAGEIRVQLLSELEEIAVVLEKSLFASDDFEALDDLDKALYSDEFRVWSST